MPRIQASKIGLVSAALTRAGIKLDDAGRRDVTSEIERAKAIGLGPQEVGAQGVLAERLEEVYQGYEDAKAAAGLVDFEDILLLNAGLIRDNLAVAEQVRQQCRWLTVDEYQDVSPLQQQVLEGWLGGRDELCVVGDPSQTVYTFAGATSDYLLGFRNRWPEATLLQLTRSYRCSPQIIDLANAVLADGDVRQRLLLKSQRAPVAAVNTRVYETEQAEAAGVADAIKRLIAKTPAEQIAILVRINSATARFERELQAVGIPYTVRGSARFMQRPEVKRAVSLLRVAAKQPGTGDVAERVAAAWNPSATPRPRRWVRRNARSGSRWPRWSAWPAVTTVSSPWWPTSTSGPRTTTPRGGCGDPGISSPAKGLEWTRSSCPACTRVDCPCAIRGDGRRGGRTATVLRGVTRARDILELSYAQAGSRRENRQPSRFLPEGHRPQPVAKRAAAKSPGCQVCR